jgi:methionyl-tRNA formyltransferase
MFVNERLDAGDVILQRAEPILPGDTAGELHERLGRLGARLLVETISRIEQGNAPRSPQEEHQVTHAPKIDKEQGRIKWDRSAVEIERMIRAFNPWPSAYTEWDGEPLKVWRAEVIATVAGVPGWL